MTVTVLLPIAKAGFDYRVPAGMQVRTGDVVRVPIGRKLAAGVAWGEGAGGIDASKIRDIESVIAQAPALSAQLRKFIDWVAWYTLAPPGMVLKMVFAGQDSEWVSEKKKKPRRTEEPQPAALAPAHPPLTPAQHAAAHTLRSKLGGGFSVSVLDGVTGSGKTEVYFDMIEACLSSGKQALVLLPEIALSVQWLLRFEKRFGFAPGVWHSAVTPARKRRTWQHVASGDARVIVGARSALFLPFKSLGVIVVDEEHDSSYKQEEGVIYHARDMAVARARHESIPALLVSATPSLETEANIARGRYARVHLPVRHGGASMPEVRLIDMRAEKLPATRWLCEPLKEALIRTVAHKQQAMLFINRRGYAPLLLCRACGHRFQCPDCSTCLVYHHARAQLQCHHCGYHAPVPKACPACKAEGKFAPCGPGVERVHEEVKALLPEARIAVMTSDADSGSAATITAMESGDIDILIGTQMIAKGHHFAGLALVGVVDADMGLNGGDLRAGEHTFQLLHQLSGRAGREQVPGSVLVQTYAPEHPVMQALAGHDRDQFMNAEARMREDAHMPPYGKLAAIIVEGRSEQEVVAFARELVKKAGLGIGVGRKNSATSFNPHSPSPTPLILGPAPAPLSRLRGRFRWRLLIKAPREFALQDWLAHTVAAHKVPATLRMKIDIDPYSFV